MMYMELLGGLLILMGAAEVMIRGAVGLAATSCTGMAAF